MRSNHFSSTVNFATKGLICLTLAVFVCCLFAIPSHSQSLSLGTLATNGSPASCNDGDGFYYYVYPYTGLALDMTCQAATVSGCSQVINGQTVTPDPWTLTIGYLNPVGAVSGLTAAKGLVVLHGGDGGTTPESYALADYYFRAGFEVVQVKWDNAWEFAYADMTGKTGNIMVAACRPATVFSWVYNNLFKNAPNFLNTAGMCGLGDSAGSAAIAYALAYYGADGYMDHVELLSGPVLSDIRAGCGVGPGLGTQDHVDVCSGSSVCQLGGGSTWTLTPNFVSGTQTTLDNWTNEPAHCAGNTTTGDPSNTDWLRESILDQPAVSNGPTPKLAYSNTSMSAWLCRSVVDHTGVNCANIGNNDSNDCPNNSSPQGWFFYQNVSTGTESFNVYPVDGCTNAEAVGSGTVPGFYPQDFGGSGSGGGTAKGQAAISYDLAGYISGSVSIPAMCVRRH